MAGGVPSSAVDVGGGVLDLIGSNRAHRNDLRARANTLGALPRRGDRAGAAYRGGAMSSGLELTDVTF